MKKWALSWTLVVMAAAVGAADLTDQEQSLLTQIRDSYAKQMGRQPTPEEEQKFLEQYRQSLINANVMAARMKAMAGGQGFGGMQLSAPPAVAPVVAPQATISEETLAKQIEALGRGQANLKIESAKDGLKVDGRAILDPEGQIKASAFDVLSGDVTYGISVGDNWVYKFMKAGSNSEPVTFATARFAQGEWQVRTVTGKQLVGTSVTPMARGVMVGRVGSAFRYEPGVGNKSAAVPEGWTLAQFQRGNVGATQFVLLEKVEEPRGSGSLNSMLGAVSSMGAIMGISKKEDYALMHLGTGKLYPINVQLDGKERTVMSNCRKRNAVINQCSSSYSFESLYSGTGKNWGHYYWKANWYSTPDGPVAVTMENGVSDVYLLNLTTGKKVSAFHRGLGITSFDSIQTPDGKLALAADWMFETHKIDDALTYLRENPDITAEAAK